MPGDVADKLAIRIQFTLIFGTFASWLLLLLLMLMSLMFLEPKKKWNKSWCFVSKLGGGCICISFILVLLNLYFSSVTMKKRPLTVFFRVPHVDVVLKFDWMHYNQLFRSMYNLPSAQIWETRLIGAIPYKKAKKTGKLHIFLLIQPNEVIISKGWPNSLSSYSKAIW